MSADIKVKLQSELDELESELRVHLPKEIKRALEFGDLRENSEYRAALDRQNVVKARIVGEFPTPQGIDSARKP